MILPYLEHRLSCCTVTHLHQPFSWPCHAEILLWCSVEKSWNGQWLRQEGESAGCSRVLWQGGRVSKHSLLGRGRKRESSSKVSFTEVTILKYCQLILILCIFLPWGHQRYFSKSTQEGQILKPYQNIVHCILPCTKYLSVNTAQTNWLCSILSTISTCLPIRIPDARGPFWQIELHFDTLVYS